MWAALVGFFRTLFGGRSAQTIGTGQTQSGGDGATTNAAAREHGTAIAASDHATVNHVGTQNIYGNEREAVPKDWWDAPNSPRFRWEQSGQSSATQYVFERLLWTQISGTPVGNPYATVTLAGQVLVDEKPLDVEGDRRWQFKPRLSVPAPDEPGASVTEVLQVKIRFWWDGAPRHVEYAWPLSWRGTARNLLDVRTGHEVSAHW